MASYRVNVKRIFPDAVLARHNAHSRRSTVVKRSPGRRERFATANWCRSARISRCSTARERTKNWSVWSTVNDDGHDGSRLLGIACNLQSSQGVPSFWQPQDRVSGHYGIAQHFEDRGGDHGRMIPVGRVITERRRIASFSNGCDVCGSHGPLNAPYELDGNDRHCVGV